MAKILDINNMLDAGSTVLDEGVHLRHVALLEAAAAVMAHDLAKALDIDVGDVSYQGGFGGLCAAFGPKHAGQECPGEIDAGDPGGDWE